MILLLRENTNLIICPIHIQLKRILKQLDTFYNYEDRLLLKPIASEGSLCFNFSLLYHSKFYL